MCESSDFDGTLYTNLRQLNLLKIPYFRSLFTLLSLNFLSLTCSLTDHSHHQNRSFKPFNSASIKPTIEPNNERHHKISNQLSHTQNLHSNFLIYHNTKRRPSAALVLPRTTEGTSDQLLSDHVNSDNASIELLLYSF